MQPFISWNVPTATITPGDLSGGIALGFFCTILVTWILVGDNRTG